MPTATELTIDSAVSALDLANEIFGDSVTVVSASISGDAIQYGIYSDGEAISPGVVPADTGVILSTGNVRDFTNGDGSTNTNISGSTSTNTAGGIDRDPDLDAAAGVATFDGVIFEASFIPDGDWITMQFVFASEEYLEYVNSSFNDPFVVTVNGVMIPITPDGQTVAINTVNQTVNPNFYVDNPAAADLYNTEMDGFTRPLTMTAPVSAGQVNTIRIALADGGDALWDSNVLIAAGSVQTVVIANDDTVSLEAGTTRVFDVLGNDVNQLAGGLTITRINGQAVEPGDSVTLTTGETVTLNADMTLSVAATGTVQIASFTYSVVDAMGNSDLGYVTATTVITPAPDGTVDGTAGGDLIDTGYTGDPDGDLVDAGDATGAQGTTGDDDIIMAFGGDDTVFAGEGNDIVFAGAGNDTVFGGAGDDSLLGEDGDDTLSGGGGGDTVRGGDGNDVIHGDEVMPVDAVLVSFEDFEGGATGWTNGITGSGGQFGEFLGRFEGTDGDSSGGPLTAKTYDLAPGYTAVVVEFDLYIIDSWDANNASFSTGPEGDAFQLYVNGDQVANELFSWSDPAFDGDRAGTVTIGGVDYSYSFVQLQDAQLGFSASWTDQIWRVRLEADGYTGDQITLGFGSTTDSGISDESLGIDDITVVSTNDPSVDIARAGGADLLFGGAGDDTIFGGAGNDTLYGDAAEPAPVTLVNADFSADGTGWTLGGGGNTLFYNPGASFNAADSGPGGTIEQTVAVSPHASYELSVDASEFGAGVGDHTLTMEVLDADGTVIATRTALIANGSSQTLTLDFTATTDSVTIRFGNPATTNTVSSDLEIGAVTITGIASADTGHDVLFGGAGDDSLFGGSGNDTLSGDAGDDLLEGGDGDDTVTGGAGADTLFGGAGNDRLVVDSGDTAAGGAGDDLFVLEDLGETADIVLSGGDTGETAGGGDTLQLGNLADLSTLTITGTTINASGNASSSGFVTLDTGATLVFEGFEQIICFAGGSRLSTVRGPVAVEDLRPGDRVLTRDNGPRPVRWIGHSTVRAEGTLAPIRIRPGVLTGLKRDLVVSPQHRLLFRGYRAELLFGEREVFVPATHLVDGVDVTQEPGGLVTYYHLMLDAHEVIFAEGAATESFHPGHVGLEAVNDAARAEMFTLFPELRADPRAYGDTARRCLRRHEAMALTA